MNCKVCGAQLTGMEVVCPGCGNPVEKEIPVVPAIQEVPAAPAMPEVQPAPVAPVVDPMQAVVPEPVAAPVEAAVPVMPEAPVAPVVDPAVAAVPVVDPAAPVMNSVPEMPAAPVMPEVQPAPVAPVVDPMQAAPAMPEVPAIQSMPEAPAVPVVDPSQPVMGGVSPMPVMNSVQPVVPQGQPVQGQVAGQPGEKPKQNKTVLLIIILIGVVAIAAVALFALGVFDSGDGDSGSANGSGSGSGSGDVADKTKKDVTKTYAGFKFTIPNGYYTKIDDESGLGVYNDSMAFTIMIDYTNTYEQYKEAYQKQYPDQAKDMVATVDGREYVALILTKEGKNVTFYISKDETSGATFIGAVAKADFTTATTTEFKVITKVLDSAKSTSSFAPGDEGDAGKDGIVGYEIDLDEWVFAAEE